MLISITSKGSRFHETDAQILLYEDNWNDWHEYKNMYQLYVFGDDRKEQFVGTIKVGRVDQKTERSLDKGGYQGKLDEDYFSLGQNEDYYEALNKLGTQQRELILNALNDIAYDLDIFVKVKDQRVLGESIMRGLSESTVRGQFHRMAHGGAKITDYKFVYTTNKNQKLSFRVIPNTMPPTNVHVLIGTNGVGKTTLLKLMTRALVEKNSLSDEVGFFKFDEMNNVKTFANVIAVSFSPFDPFIEIVEPETKERLVIYSYIGINTSKRGSQDQKVIGSPKSSEQLSDEFSASYLKCRDSKDKQKRWNRVINILQSDQMFAASRFCQNVLDTEGMTGDSAPSSKESFEELSSGHKIVLLTLTKLVETVEECSLVLFDEPEAHLHPPFLSAFIRALSELLIDRNGVAIIATHSPVVLQEVPKSCVTKIRRVGEETFYEAPRIETFGENVGTLTSDVFRLELTTCGYYTLLREAATYHQTYNSAVRRFEGQIGEEGRAVLRALTAELGETDET